jgi:hypothetical protein
MSPSNCACVGVTGGVGMSAGAVPSLDGVGVPSEVIPVDEPEGIKRAFEKMISRIIKRRG